MRFVPVKSTEQQSVLVLHPARIVGSTAHDTGLLAHMAEFP
jgi:hypothetical protein